MEEIESMTGSGENWWGLTNPNLLNLGGLNMGDPSDVAAVAAAGFA